MSPRLLILAACLLTLGGGPAATAAPDCSASGYDTARCPLVQPGMRVLGPGSESHCTLGWLLAGSDGRTYALTGGGCADAALPTPLDTRPPPASPTRWPGGSGPLLHDVVESPLARAVLRDVSDRADVLWVRLLPRTAYDARVVAFGAAGPLDTRVDNDPWYVSFYGHGCAVTGSHECLGPVARQAVLPLGRHDPEVLTVAVDSTAADAGAPVMGAEDDLPVLGVMSGRSTDVAGASGAGQLVYRLGPLVARAERALGVRLRLMTRGLGTAA